MDTSPVGVVASEREQEPSTVDAERAPSGDGLSTPDRRRASGWLGRFVGLLIASISIGAALVLWSVVSARAPSVGRTPRSGTLFGLWHVTYDSQAPALTIALGAVGLGLLFAAAAAIVERVVLDRARRSTDAHTKLLAPKLVMAETLEPSLVPSP